MNSMGTLSLKSNEYACLDRLEDFFLKLEDSWATIVHVK